MLNIPLIIKIRIFATAFCLAPALAAALPPLGDNPIADGKISVQSWKTQRDFGIVKQNLDFSCGAASIATLLNNFYGQHLTETEILQRMNKTDWRASFDDMQRVMPELGFEAKGYALPFEQLVRMKIPVIVYLKYRRDDHFSVLRGISGNTVLLADPSLGHMSMSREQFLAAWKTRSGEMEGKILAVVPKDAGMPRHSAFFQRQPQRQTHLAAKMLGEWQPR